MLNAPVVACVRTWACLSLTGGLNPMEKIRIALKKGEAIKYVGHLDFGLRDRAALRRAITGGI